VDLVVVTGDVADDGPADVYDDALALVGAYAQQRGASQVYCVGNHDAREPFASVLGTGHRDPAGRDAGQIGHTASAERAAVSVVGGYRVISLDSLVPGQAQGEISHNQLAWLRGVLAEPAQKGSVVVLHHPPIGLDLPLPGFG
jgi:3',5'-cyclic AMP phosphodiesterase CpdA